MSEGSIYLTPHTNKYLLSVFSAQGRRMSSVYFRVDPHFRVATVNEIP